MQTSIISNQYQRPDSNYARHFITGSLLYIFAFMAVLCALLMSHSAQASLTYPANIAGGTKLQVMCANCHVEWDGGGFGNANRIAQQIWSGYSGETPTNDGFALYDMDMDGTVTGLKSNAAGTGEYSNALSTTTTRPANTVRWVPMFPDKDGDGCIQLYNRLNESGVMQPPLYIISLGYIGGLRGFQTYGPRGWDIDDNDATQGCNLNASGVGWPTSSTPGTGFTNPGSTTDSSSPPQVTDLRGSSLAGAGLPLAWTAVGDDSAGGAGAAVAAHSYDLRYTQTGLVASKFQCGGARSEVAGSQGCNVRDPSHWKRLWNIADSDATIGTWNAGTGAAPLMRVLYEPIPSAVGLTQTCTSLGVLSTTGACPTGASHVIKTVGDVIVKGALTVGTNTITNLQLYWVAIRVSDGVNIPSTLEGAVVTEHISPVSNIVGITAGASGALISTFNGGTTPVALSGTTASVSVIGKGLTAANAARLFLTDTTGAIIREATITTAGTSTGTTPVVGTFNVLNLTPGSKYTLETRTASGTDATAAWVDAVTIATAAPTLTSIAPASRGQGATGVLLDLVGANFLDPMIITFSDAAITGSVTVNTSTTATAIIETDGATVATGAVPGPSAWVTSSNQPSNAVAFSITAAPSFDCTPALPLTGFVGEQYGPSTCTATGGVPNYTWLSTGFPAGVIAVPSGTNSETLTIEGKPTAVGTISGLIKLTDSKAGTSAAAHAVTVDKGSQIIVLNCTPLSVLTSTSTCVALASSGLSVTLSSLTPETCAISNGTVTSLAAGVCTVAADQIGNDNYNPASQVTSTIAVNKLDQTITSLSCTPLIVVIDDPIVCTATASSGLPIVLTNFTPTTCSLSGSTSGSTVTGITAGICVIAAGQPGNESYNIAPIAAVAVTIDKRNQTITEGGFLPTTVSVGGSTTVSATASSMLPVTFSSSTPAVCSVSGNIVTGATAGLCIITSNQSGDATYHAALPATQNIAVASVDLLMEVVSKTATSVGIGHSFAITSVERNLGPGTSTSNTVKFYLSVDATITTADKLLTGSRIVPSLPAITSSLSAITMVTVPYTIAPGVYTVGACADVPSVQVESNEGNNCKAALGTIIVKRNVDLQMTAVSKTVSTVGQTKTFTISNTVKNVGTTHMTAATFTVKLYLSTDATITTADITIGSRQVNRLLAGQSNTANTIVTVPGAVLPRVYYVGACADTANVQIEASPTGLSLEGNNCKAAAGTLTVVRNVDLVMSAVSSPDDTVIEGLDFIIDNSVKNVGTAAMLATPITTTRFYLSTDAIITTADTLLLGTRTVAGLLGGATSSALTVVTLPDTVLPGVYYIGAIADGTNLLLESVETNNTNSNSPTPSSDMITVIFDPTP